MDTDEQSEAAEPRYLGLFVRPMFEVIHDTCLDERWDHQACLLYRGSRWPVPLEGSDLDGRL